MTNAEKFKEVFGFEPEIPLECLFPKEVCKVASNNCYNCPFLDWWHREYLECFECDMEKVKELLNEDG